MTLCQKHCTGVSERVLYKATHGTHFRATRLRRCAVKVDRTRGTNHTIKAESSTATERQTAIQAKDIHVNVGDSEVLKGINLSVARGTFHLLLGPNGCGKSTLLRALCGLVKPLAGEVYVDEPTSFIFQNPDNQVIFPTVAADVAFGLGRFKLPESEVRGRVSNALQQVNMGGFLDRQTHTLSGGQKQRVAIAGALAEGPKVLLCDELTTFLDDEEQLGVLKAVRGLVGREPPVTALWVTHRLEELEFADRASYMENGTIQFEGSSQEVAAYLRSLGAHF